MQDLQNCDYLNADQCPSVQEEFCEIFYQIWNSLITRKPNQQEYLGNIKSFLEDIFHEVYYMYEGKEEYYTEKGIQTLLSIINETCKLPEIFNLISNPMKFKCLSSCFKICERSEKNIQEAIGNEILKREDLINFVSPELVLHESNQTKLQPIQKLTYSILIKECITKYGEDLNSILDALYDEISIKSFNGLSTNCQTFTFNCIYQSIC